MEIQRTCRRCTVHTTRKMVSNWGIEVVSSYRVLGTHFRFSLSTCGTRALNQDSLLASATSLGRVVTGTTAAGMVDGALRRGEDTSRGGRHGRRLMGSSIQNGCIKDRPSGPCRAERLLWRGRVGGKFEDGCRVYEELGTGALTTLNGGQCRSAQEGSPVGGQQSTAFTW